MLVAALIWALTAPLAQAERLRLAFFATELSRDGPGLLLRDIRRDDPQVMAVVRVIARAQPDILVLSGIDYDMGGVTLNALADHIDWAGWTFDTRFALPPNAGRPTGLDLNGDGRSHRAADAHGWGTFSGEGGLALLSRFPVQAEAVRDFSTLLWQDLPDAQWPLWPDGTPYYAKDAQQVLRLATNAMWAVPVQLPTGAQLSVLAFANAPPVFDGPEDRNGLRNADQLRFWQAMLDGAFGPPPRHPVLLGNGNVDPVDGEGRHAALRALLADPALQDPAPRSAGAAAAANPDHRGDPALDTVDWWEDDGGPGNLRVSYALPGAGLTVLGSGVLWSDPAQHPDLAKQEATASRHRLVWVDIEMP